MVAIDDVVSEQGMREENSEDEPLSHYLWHRIPTIYATGVRRFCGWSGYGLDMSQGHDPSNAD